MTDNQGLTWASDPVMRAELRRLLDARQLCWGAKDPSKALAELDEAFADFWRQEAAWMKLKEKADGHT